MAVDRRLGRVLLVGLAGNSAACGVVEMFDARTGKRLQALPLVPGGTYRNGECAAGIDSATSRAFVLYTAGSYDLGRGTYMSVSTLDTRGNRLVGAVELLQSNETRGTFLNRSVVVDERDNRVLAAATQGENGSVKGSPVRVLVLQREMTRSRMKGDGGHEEGQRCRSRCGSSSRTSGI